MLDAGRRKLAVAETAVAELAVAETAVADGGSSDGGSCDGGRRLQIGEVAGSRSEVAGRR